MKKIVKVMVFYDDGTFDECNASTPQPTLQYPPGVRTTGPFTPGCAKCGKFVTGSCGKLDCPNGYTNPWDNRNKITD